MNKNRMLLFISLLTLVAPKQDLQCISDREFLGYGAVGTVAIVGSFFIADHYNEKGERTKDLDRIKLIKKSMQQYRNTFKDQIEEIVNLQDLQAFAQLQKDLLLSENIASIHRDAEDLLGTISERRKKNQSQLMHNTYNELSQFREVTALASMIARRADLVCIGDNNLNQTTLLTHALQQNPPSSNLYPARSAVAQIRNDIQFLKEHDFTLPATHIMTYRLEQCASLLQASPQFLNESRFAEQAAQQQELINIEKRKAAAQAQQANAQAKQADAQTEQAKQMTAANRLKQDENNLLAQRLRDARNQQAQPHQP